MADANMRARSTHNGFLRNIPAPEPIIIVDPNKLFSSAHSGVMGRWYGYSLEPSACLYERYAIALVIGMQAERKARV